VSAFIDTSGFLALLDADDLHHPEAAPVWVRLIENQEPLHTTNYVLVESIALLHHRFGVTAVRRFQEELLPSVALTWVDEPTHAAAVRAVIAGGRKGPSLVDCVSFDVITRLGASTVLAYDRHFSERGFIPGGALRPVIRAASGSGGGV
jgi:predicted nucleic acid-binding protein